jgi:uncharacterized protein YdcH (DUF465 family)
MTVAIGETELRERLLKENEEYRRLAAEHHHYDEMLEELNHRHHLSEEEHLQEITLKKKKLHLKDQMYAILQRYRREIGSQR